mgnify:CR=1 FL=1
MKIKKINNEAWKNIKEVKRIFKAFGNDKIFFVGGVVRNSILREKIGDIDLATKINFKDSKSLLQTKGFKFYDLSKGHGTISIFFKNTTLEITSMRIDKKTYGRRAEVEFTGDIYLDSCRRDFSINAIYSSFDGEIYDPQKGLKDLKLKKVRFIGDPKKRIKEDYLRILRYVRFFTNYSNHKHKPEIIKIIKRNIGGISKLSSERLIDEFKKLTKSHGFAKLFQDNDSLEIIEIIFPQLKNLAKFKKLNTHARDNLFKIDFIFLLSLMIVDGTDNTDYFLYKFNISKKDQKRLKLIDFFYKEKTNLKNFTEKNFNKIFYFNGKQAVIDIINFKLFTSNKVEKKLIKLIEVYKDKVIPTMPIGANTLMAKYNIPEGKILGNKLKMIEEAWVENGFTISEKNIQKIAKG